MLVVLLTFSSGIISRAAQSSKFELVTDAASLNAGDVLVIINKAHSVGLSTGINSTSIDGIPVTFSGDCVVATTALQEITLEGSASGWYLNVGSAYLCTTSTDKSLTSKNSKDEYSKASISIDKTTSAATISFKKKSSYDIGYNYESNVFKTYNTLPNDGEIYIYRSTGDNLSSLKLDGNTSESVNAQAIDKEAGNTVDRVTVGRTFVADGGWYTLCLPFALTAADIESRFHGADFQEFASTDVSADGSCVLHFRKVTQTEAGKPYMVRPLPGKGDVIDPEFENKTIIGGEPQSVEHSGGADGLTSCSFVGIYDPAYISGASNRFVGAKGTSLVQPNGDGEKLKGLRAYIVLPQTAKMARLNVDGAQTDAIATVDASGNLSVHTIYNINGQRVGSTEQCPSRGIYIVNGKKILIK